MKSIYFIRHLSKPTECTKSGVDLTVNYVLWGDNKVSVRFISCDSGTHSDGRCDCGEAVHVSGGGIWEIAVPSLQFAVNLKLL